LHKGFINHSFYDIFYKWLKDNCLSHPVQEYNIVTRRAFIHGRIITPEIEVADGTLVIEGGQILSLGKASSARIPDGTDVVDCSGKTLAPGFIDLHLHGGGGYDFSDEQGLVGTARFHASCGTTSILPTLCPDTLPNLKKQLTLLGNGYPASEGGPLPDILGIHLEGPFLSVKRKGCFASGSFSLFEPGMVKDLSEASKGALRLMTLAPELPGGMDLIREVSEAGIIPCLGHSDATYEQTIDAVSAGLRHAVHLFNAVRGFHHRAPGCAVAALLHPEVSVEMIVDGHHLHKAAVEMICRLKGEDKVILVSDAVPLAGHHDGTFMLGGKAVKVEEGRAVNEEGSLAGSLLTMADALKKTVQWAGIPLRDALRMASLNPARLLGLSNKKGRLFAGGDADFVILSESLDIQEVYIGGIPVG
jgi:N-acetylglucosamine-6-phosphate deacetylase